MKDILYTKCEFFEIEGLHEIVIGTERESFDLIYLLRESREKKKWDMVIPRLEHTHQRESIDTRHETIDDEEVIGLSCDHLKCLFSIECMVDLVSLGREIEDDILCDDLVIFGDEDFHRESVMCFSI